jgi:hypothetical protein
MSDWMWRHENRDWRRWQLDAQDGMMLGIVERPHFEVGGIVVEIPLGWRWRNSWAGSNGGWAPTKGGAMRKAEAVRDLQ